MIIEEVIENVQNNDQQFDHSLHKHVIFTKVIDSECLVHEEDNKANATVEESFKALDGLL